MWTLCLEYSHQHRNHCESASNCLSPPGTVDVYNSLPASHSSILNCQLVIMKHVHHPSESNINVKMQNGLNECGQFTIAFAMDLREENPTCALKNRTECMKIDMSASRRVVSCIIIHLRSC